MRVSYVLLVAATALLASCELVSATTSDLAKVATRDGTSTRSLRTNKTTATAVAREKTSEERAAEEIEIEAKILDDILADHAYAKKVFRSWLQNGQTQADIEKRLKVQGLLGKYSSVVKQYGQYLTILEGKAV